MEAPMQSLWSISSILDIALLVLLIKNQLLEDPFEDDNGIPLIREATGDYDD